MKSIITILVIISCSIAYAHDNKKLELSKAKELPYEVLSESLFYGGATITFVNGKLIARAGINSKFFHIYNNNGKLLTSFLNYGRGPGEMLQPTTIGAGASLDEIFVYDSFTKTVFLYNMDEILAGKLLPKDTKRGIELREVFYGVNGVYSLGKNLYLYDGTTPPKAPELKPNRFALVDDSGKALNTYSTYPTSDDNSAMKLSLDRGTSSLSISPNKKFFANTGVQAAVLEVFTIEDKKIILSGSNVLIAPKRKGKNLSSPKAELYSVSAGDKYIFALYCDYVSSKEYIIAFNTKAEIIDIFKAPSEIMNMAYNQKDGYLYMLLEEDDEGTALIRQKIELK